MHANEEGQCPRVRVLRGQLRDAARAISEMRGVKVHRQEMVRNLITETGEAVLRLDRGEGGLDMLCSVLTKVGEGDLDEEDDGYYSSSDEKGVVTEEMAARGVGEAGCVTVSDKIWNSLVPRDLSGVYLRQLREDSAAVEKSRGGRPGPVDAMLESLITETKGLRRTKRPETPHGSSVVRVFCATKTGPERITIAILASRIPPRSGGGGGGAGEEGLCVPPPCVDL